VRQVFWSRAALDEFDGIIAWIAQDNPPAAGRVADRIEHAVEALAFMPTGRPGRVAGTYEKIVANLPYIVAYALGTAPTGAPTLTILRIIHTARNWPEDAWPED
jgi:toxin ParE1/3/4